LFTTGTSFAAPSASASASSAAAAGAAGVAAPDSEDDAGEIPNPHDAVSVYVNVPPR
jgi:hypothetical protein